MKQGGRSGREREWREEVAREDTFDIWSLKSSSKVMSLSLSLMDKDWGLVAGEDTCDIWSVKFSSKVMSFSAMRMKDACFNLACSSSEISSNSVEHRWAVQ